jgi:hypothetical protein
MPPPRPRLGDATLLARSGQLLAYRESSRQIKNGQIIATGQSAREIFASRRVEVFC